MPPLVHEQLSTTIENLYRSESGRVLATLVRLLGDLDLAEEAMHEAFAAALESWPQTGIPDKPRPWLISTGRLFDTCFEYDDHLRANGHFAGGEAIQPAETALTLYWKNGKVATTDGPYAETKEQLGGILVLEARDMNHAVQLMSQHPALTYGNMFEIRPTADLNEMIKASEQRRRNSR